MANHDTIFGLKSLVHDAVDATVELVRVGHESVTRGLTSATQNTALGRPVRAVETVRMGATHGILHTITAINRTVEAGTDAVLRATLSPAASSAPALPLRDDVMGGSAWLGDAVVGGLNGAIGDHLARRRNPLDARVFLRIADRYFVPNLCEKDAFSDLEHVVIFVHGLAATEWSWVLGAEQSWGDPATSFGSLLHAEIGATPIYVRYNTGRPLAESGEALARCLNQLQKRAPNLKRIDIVGHSMGGLVTRQACRLGVDAEFGWTGLVREVIYLGSPHTGAPLARIAKGVAGFLGGIDLPATLILANILDGRSDGIKDLSDGLSQALPLAHARHTFVSGTVTRDPGHPIGWILGDLLVRRTSAEGEGVVVESVPVGRHHSGRVLHHELQNHPAVFEIVRGLFE